jgi:iron complex transport system ATP-binding protein
VTTLSVKNIQVPYSKKGMLPSFSFEVESPAQVFIAGANGIGKSTFLKQLAGSLNSHQAVHVDQKLISAFSLKERAHRIGFLEQQHAIHFPLVVKDLVVMGRYAHKSSLEPYSQQDYESVFAVLDELGITYLYDKNFLHLSGGEQQLCLLAQLAIQDPAIMLLDEPTQSLDLHNKERVFNWIEKQTSEKGKLVLCVTHDLHWITKKKGYLLSLNNSQINLTPLREGLVDETIEKLKRQEY